MIWSGYDARSGVTSLTLEFAHSLRACCNLAISPEIRLRSILGIREPSDHDCGNFMADVMSIQVYMFERIKTR